MPTEADLATIFEVAERAGIVWLKFDSEAAVICLLYTSDAAEERSSVDPGGGRIIKKNMTKKLLGRVPTKIQRNMTYDQPPW